MVRLCAVSLPLSPWRYRLTSRSLPSGTRPGSGSLNTTPPAGTVTDGRPPNVMRRLDPGTSSGPDR